MGTVNVLAVDMVGEKMIIGTPFRQLSWWERWKYPRPVDFSHALNEGQITVGISGVGKSSLLSLLAIEAIEQGKSVWLIDTHHDVFLYVLHACIAKEIPPENVILIDLPAQSPVALNPLKIAGVDDYVCVDSLLAAARGVWREGWGSRMEDCLRHLFLTLQVANLPLSASLPFLENEAIHKVILNKIDHAELENFWMYFWKYHRAEIESSRNKLSSFLLNPLIKPMFDSVESNVNFYDAFNSAKIVLVNLSRNYFKDDSSRGFLGAIFMSMAYNALLRRENEKEKHPVAMLCDEVHEYYIPEFFNPVLTGSRKYGAGLKMFTQSLGHFPQKDLEIVFSAVASIISFAVGSADAKRLTDEMFTFRGESMVKRQQRDLYGGYGEKQYYSAGELRQHAMNELMNQAQREVFVRVKRRDGGETYMGNVCEVPRFEVSPEREMEYRQEVEKILKTP